MTTYLVSKFCLCDECVKETKLPRTELSASDFGCYDQHCHRCGDVIHEGWGWTGERFSKPEGLVIVDWDDVVDATHVIPDEHGDRPWDSCDGYEHEAIPVHRLDDDSNLSERRGYVYWDHTSHLIELSDPERMSDYRYARQNGASKQVAKELAARRRQQRLDQLVSWYDNGVEAWGIWCNIPDGIPRQSETELDTEDEDSPWFGFDGDVNESVWGFYSYEEAVQESVEITRQAVAALEKDGNIVLNQPGYDRRESYRENRREVYEMRPRLFDWDEKGSYDANDGTPLVKRGNSVQRAQYKNFGEWYSQHS